MNKSFLLTTLVALLPMSTFAEDRQRGEGLAKRWCANCHIVEARASSGRADSVPSFPAIASSSKTTVQSLKASMTVQHGQMPIYH